MTTPLYRVERELRSASGAFCCQCGDIGAFAAYSRFRSRNRAAERRRILCELHGRAFAIRWKLDLPGAA